MSAAWQTRFGAGAGSILQGLAQWLARPQGLRWLQRVAIALLLLWILRSLALAFWSFFPSVAAPALDAPVINPPPLRQGAEATQRVDIDRLVAAQLFGAPDDTALASAAAAAAEAQPMSEAEAAEALAGIEDGAPATRLPLSLSGVVSASEAGLGQAIIEHRNEQDLYRVGDELPAGDRVLLAKVMPNQVVIDNAGRYELLRLFETSKTLGVAASSAQRAAPRSPLRDATAPASREPVAAGNPGNVADSYRDRLYSDPQSLAEVVNVSAVREGDTLLGYRLQPGRAAAEFEALGFRAGDLVTAVNGLSLSDPANTVRLYQAMRSAEQAVFDLTRDGQAISLTVSLAEEMP